MLSPPDDLADADIAAALARHWGFEAASLEYRAVGFGSHHWLTEDTAGRRWFVTVDDCEGKRLAPEESTDGFFARLHGALSTARTMRRLGLDFAVAPIDALDGEPLARLSNAYAMAVYPHLEGVSHAYGAYEGSAERLAVVDLLIALHGADPAAAPLIGVETFELAHRGGLEAAMADLNADWSSGPFAEQARALLAQRASGVRRLLAHHDDLVRTARERPMVITHGEPHRANTMNVEGRTVLVDWDTALLAPAERDLWMVGDDAGDVARAYEAAMGRAVDPRILDLYRLRWDLSEIAVYIVQFRDPHGDDPNTRESWKNLQVYLDPDARWPQP